MTVSAAGQDVKLRDANGIKFGEVSAKDLTVTAGGLVEQTASPDKLTVTGDATLTTTAGGITLENADNDFQGTVAANGAGVTLKDGNGGIKLGAVTATGGNVTVDALNGGNIDVNAGATVKSETGDVTLTANGGISTISGTMDAKKNAKVVSENGSIVLADGSKVTADTKVVLNGKTGVTGGGTVDATGAELDVNAAGGNVNLTGKVLAKSATFDAKDVSVYGANNDFTGDVSAKATAGSIAIRDKNALKLKSADATQDARVVAGGTLDVAGAVKGGGNVLLQSTGADVNVEAAVGGEDRKPKNVTVAAKSNVEITAAANATEDLYVKAGGNINLPKAPEAGATMALVAGGRIDATAPKAATLYTKDRQGETVTDVESSRQVIDSTGPVERTVKGNTTIGVKTTDKVELTVNNGTLTVGSAASGGKDLKVTEVLAEGGTQETTVAAASGATSVSGISAGKDATITADAIGGTSIAAGGDVDIKTTGGNYSVSETKSGGNTTLDVAGSVGKVDSIEAGKDLDLDASGSLDASTVKAGGTADIVTGGDAIVSELDAGDILADIGGSLESDEIVNAKGDANLVVKGSVTAEEIAAGGALVLESGDLSFTTMSAKSIEATTGSVSMGAVTADEATFKASGSITDNGSHVEAKTLTMTASGDIGSKTSPIETKTATLKEIRGNNVYLEETSSGTIGVGTIHANNRLELHAPNLGPDGRGRLARAGAGLIEAGKAGALLDVAGHIGGVGKGNHLEIRVAGPLEVRSGDLNAKNEMWGSNPGYIYVIVDAPGFDIGQWEGYNRNGGDKNQKIPGLVIVNGQVLEGNPDFIRNIHRAEAFTIETPELKSKQGVFGSPVFIHTDMDVSEAASIGSVDYLQMDWGSFNPIEDDELKQWLRPAGLLGPFMKKRDNPMGTVELYTKDYTDFETRRKAEEPKAKPDRSEKEKAKKEAKLREKADAAAQEAANREARDASPDVSSSASGPASSPGA